MAGIELTDFIAVNYVKTDRDSYVHFLTEIDFNCTEHHRIISTGATVIFTSKFNAWYLKNVLKLTAASLHGVDVGKSYTVNYNGRHFTFCFFYSKSSTGSVALLLSGEFGVYLYTGNFCYYNGITATICPEMKKIISTQSLSRLYFDATYYEQKSDFMGYDELMDKIAKIIINGLHQTVYIIIDKVGLEGLLIDILLHVQGKLPDVLFHVNLERFEMLSVLGYDHLFTTDEKNARVFVRSSSFLKKKHQDEAYDLIFIKRTSEICQNFKSYQVINGWHMFTFYTHSSHEQCCNMINLFKPESLIPTSLTVDKCGIEFKDFTKDESFIISEMQSKKTKVSSTCLQRPASSKRKDTVLKNVTETKRTEDVANTNFTLDQLHTTTRKTLNNGSFISKKNIPFPSKLVYETVGSLDKQTTSSNILAHLNSAKSFENQGNKFVKIATQDDPGRRRNICNNNLLNKTSIHSRNIKQVFHNASSDRNYNNLALIEKLKERDKSIYVKLSYNVQKILFKQLLLSEVHSKQNAFKFKSKSKSKSIYPTAKIRLLLNPKIIRKLFLFSVKNGKVFLKPTIESVTARVHTASFSRNNLSQTMEKMSNNNFLKENQKISLSNENKVLNIQNTRTPFKPMMQPHVKQNHTVCRNLPKSSVKGALQTLNIKINSEECLLQRHAPSITLNNHVSVVRLESEIENDSSALVIDCSVISNKPNVYNVKTKSFENDNLKCNPLIANISTLEKINKTSFHSDIISSDMQSGSSISKTMFSLDKNPQLALACKIPLSSSTSELLQNVSVSESMLLETGSTEKDGIFGSSGKMKGEFHCSNVERLKIGDESNFDPNSSSNEQNSDLGIKSNESGNMSMTSKIFSDPESLSEKNKQKFIISEKKVQERSCGNTMLKVSGILKVKLDRNMEESSEYFYSDKRQCYFPMSGIESFPFNGFDSRLVKQDMVNYRKFIKFLLKLSKLKKYRRRNET